MTLNNVGLWLMQTKSTLWAWVKVEKRAKRNVTSAHIFYMYPPLIEYNCVFQLNEGKTSNKRESINNEATTFVVASQWDRALWHFWFFYLYISIRPVRSYLRITTFIFPKDMWKPTKSMNEITVDATLGNNTDPPACSFMFHVVINFNWQWLWIILKKTVAVHDVRRQHSITSVCWMLSLRLVQ